MALNRKRLVYFERWFDPIAEQILGAQDDIELTKLLYADPEAENWPSLESAVGYQVSAGTELQPPWGGNAALLVRCPNMLALSSAGAGYDVIDVDAYQRPAQRADLQQPALVFSGSFSRGTANRRTGSPKRCARSPRKRRTIASWRICPAIRPARFVSPLPTQPRWRLRTRIRSSVRTAFAPATRAANRTCPDAATRCLPSCARAGISRAARPHRRAAPAARGAAREGSANAAAADEFLTIRRDDRPDTARFPDEWFRLQAIRAWRHFAMRFARCVLVTGVTGTHVRGHV